MKTKTGTKVKALVPEGLQNQRAYGKKLLANGCDFNLIIADAFVRGIRDIGYKNHATALNELVDNAIQADASTVQVAFGFEGNTAKPSAIAVIDDGHGMDRVMIRAAVMWGGTHRENDRGGFGRFGYGLPSACVSMGRRFTVYSWNPQEPSVHAVTLDIDDISNGKYRDPRGAVVVPDAVETPLPGWVIEHINRHFPAGLSDSGTVVLIEKLDRLRWKTAKKLQERLREEFGVVYRNYLRRVVLKVEGLAVEPVDPLFMTPGARFYKGDAEGLPSAEVSVKDRDTGDLKGGIKVRYAFLSPKHFGMKSASHETRAFVRSRQAIMADHLGVIVMRAGRQIDVVRLPRDWHLALQNNDRFFMVELDFDPTLDEEFSVTTSKQQIGLTERIWELLREAGVLNAIRDLRKRARKELKDEDVDATGGDGVRPAASELAMLEAKKYQPTRAGGQDIQRQREAIEALEEHVQKRAEEAGLPAELMEREHEAEQVARPYKVEREMLPGAPFYRVVQRGGQVVLLVNEGHRFYTDVYAASWAAPQLRSALEVQLFVMGESELDAAEDRRRFYETERNEWSRRLNVALDLLGNIVSSDDDDHIDSDVEEKQETTSA